MELICLGDNKAHALGLVGRLWAKGGKTMKSVKTNSRRRNMIVIKKVRGNLSTNYQKGAERQCQSDPWEERPVCHLGVARCQQAASELVAQCSRWSEAKEDPNVELKGEQRGGDLHWHSARLHSGQSQHQWGEVGGGAGDGVLDVDVDVVLVHCEVTCASLDFTVDSINGEKFNL